MKMICINNDMCEKALTNGRVYDVENAGGMYKIENNFGRMSNYFCWRFVDMREYRRLKLEKLDIVFNSNDV